MPKITVKESARRWRKLAVKRAELLHEMRTDLTIVALLASDKPEFFNPLTVLAAKKVRDRVLAEHRTNHELPS